jgi:nucleoside-diphosphate-sugar epimerase
MLRSAMRVLVTGASGFVGGYVCRELSGRGHEVQALVRRPGSEPVGTGEVAGDLSDEEALTAALAAAAPEAAVHLAAEIASQRDAGRINETNVEGTRRLLAACNAAATRKFVFASTVVTGDAHGELLEEDRPLPVETAYGRSKQAGEELVRESGMEHAIVRPGHVYGPGGWFEEEFVTRVRQPGRFAVIGKGDNWWDVVRVEDVASAFADCVERASSGDLYHVADDEPITLYDFVALTAAELGVGRPRRVPKVLARLAAGRDPVTAVVRSAKTSNRRIKDRLGWEPQFPSAKTGVPDAVSKLVA